MNLFFCIFQAFQQFDTEGDGTADVGAMQEALKNSNSANFAGELGYVVRTLQACSLTPGIDHVQEWSRVDFLVISMWRARGYQPI